MSAARLWLASTSPYRRRLLGRLGVPFECASPQVDERALAAEVDDPRHVASLLAAAKATAVARARPGAFVLGGDQLVAIDGEILGKPGSPEGARRQLGRLAGREHRLVTAICLVDPEGRERSHVDEHRMKLRPLTPGEIERYVARDEPVDCAGSYKVEGLGIALFEAIEGDDFTAIQGLGLMATSRLLRAAGFDVP